MERWGGGGRPAVVLHGGFWRAAYDLHLMDGLCADLARRGYDAWNVEYRRLGEDGGGWPGTFDDVRAALALAATTAGTPCVLVGHSAGGHLALWAAADAPAHARHVLALAPVADLAMAAELGLSDGAADRLVHGERSRFVAASPADRLPLGVPATLVHGADDDTVPVDMSRRYAEAAREAGDEVDLVVLDGVGHMEVVDPDQRAWAEAAGRLP